MPVSDGLQAYFDKQRKKRDIWERLKKMQGDIDPAFMQSFEDFRLRILGIVEENPEASEIVVWEIEELDYKLHHASRKHNLKRVAVIAEAVEK